MYRNLCGNDYDFNNPAYYPETQINSQKYYGPPPWYNGGEPCESEIFISGLPPEITGYNLLKLTSKIGFVYQIRIPVTYTEAKGFAFVTYIHKVHARKAIEELNGTQFMGRTIAVCTSYDTRTLQIFNWPRVWTESQSFHCLNAYLKDVKAIKLYPDEENPRLNQGFVLVDFRNHNAAAVGRRDIKNNVLFEATKCSHNVGWARVDFDLPEDVFRQAKDLYIGNLPPKTTLDEVNRAISRCLKGPKVMKLKDKFGFIYFEDHDAAQEALLKLKAAEISIRGHVLTFNWVKGEYSRNKKSQHTSKVIMNEDLRSSHNLVISGLPIGVTVSDIQEALNRFIDFSKVTLTVAENYASIFFYSEEAAELAFLKIKSGPPIRLRNHEVVCSLQKIISNRDAQIIKTMPMHIQPSLQQHQSFSSSSCTPPQHVHSTHVYHSSPESLASGSASPDQNVGLSSPPVPHNMEVDQFFSPMRQSDTCIVNLLTKELQKRQSFVRDQDFQSTPGHPMVHSTPLDLSRANRQDMAGYHTKELRPVYFTPTRMRGPVGVFTPQALYERENPYSFIEPASSQSRFLSQNMEMDSSQPRDSQDSGYCASTKKI